MSVFRVPRFATLMALCAFITSLAPTASAQVIEVRDGKSLYKPNTHQGAIRENAYRTARQSQLAEPIPGDVTGDGILSLPDANLLKDHLLERAPLAGDALTRADADQDDAVNPADSVWIINKITTTGTVSIDVTPDSGSWTLTGPSGFSTVTQEQKREFDNPKPKCFIRIDA